MNELSNKAENEKMYFENNLNSASEVINSLEQKVLHLSGGNEKAKMIVDDYKMELERTKNELDMWKNKFEMLDNRYQKELQSKTVTFDREVMDVLEKFRKEKEQYENIIRALVGEIENMKGDPNYSYKITLLVRDLESRIGRLMEVYDTLQRAMSEQKTGYDKIVSKTPERFKRSPNKEANMSFDEKPTTVKSFVSNERFGGSSRRFKMSMPVGENGKFTSYQ
jgi:chromosome segregation ATPase